MRTLARTVTLTSLAVMTTVGTASAGEWYYTWSCAGRCSPGRLTIEGREGPFATREECEWTRDRDTRADEFVAEGNLGGLSSCEEVVREPGTGAVVLGPSSSSPPAKVRIASMEVGLALGPGWTTTAEGGDARSGAATLGLELESHTGRDVGGGALQLGLYGTRLEAAMLGAEPRTVLAVPLSVGIVLTPTVYHRGGTRVGLDLGASLGGLLLAGCGDCAGPVFDETITFGYTLRAGLDVFTSGRTGLGVDVVFPRWQLGSATAGNLELESPRWMIRVSMVGRPEP